MVDVLAYLRTFRPRWGPFNVGAPIDAPGQNSITAAYAATTSSLDRDLQWVRYIAYKWRLFLGWPVYVVATLTSHAYLAAVNVVSALPAGQRTLDRFLLEFVLMEATGYNYAVLTTNAEVTQFRIITNPGRADTDGTFQPSMDATSYDPDLVPFRFPYGQAPTERNRYTFEVTEHLFTPPVLRTLNVQAGLSDSDSFSIETDPVDGRELVGGVLTGYDPVLRETRMTWALDGQDWEVATIEEINSTQSYVSLFRPFQNPSPVSDPTFN